MMTGSSNVPVDLSASATLRDYLAEVIRQYPELRFVLLDEQANLHENLPIFINGRNPRLLPNYMDMILQPEDAISLFSPFSSGRINVEVLRQPDVEKKGKE